MKRKHIFSTLLLLMLGSTIKAQSDPYAFLVFPKGEIGALLTTSFNHVMFSFKSNDNVGGQSGYVLQGLAYDGDGNAIGSEFELPVLQRNPAFLMLNNRTRGIFKLTANQMRNSGMTGEIDWYLRPVRFIQPGQRMEYVGYILTSTVPPSGNMASRSPTDGTTAITLNPSPPAALD